METAKLGGFSADIPRSLNSSRAEPGGHFRESPEQVAYDKGYYNLWMSIIISSSSSSLRRYKSSQHSHFSTLYRGVQGVRTKTSGGTFVIKWQFYIEKYWGFFYWLSLIFRRVLDAVKLIRRHRKQISQAQPPPDSLAIGKATKFVVINEYTQTHDYHRQSLCTWVFLYLGWLFDDISPL